MDHPTRTTALLLSFVLLACFPPARAGTPPWLEVLEARYLDLRDARDALDVARYRGVEGTSAGAPLAEVRDRYAALRAAVMAGIAAAEARAGTAVPGLFEVGGEDARALAAMRKAVAAMPDPAAPDGDEHPGGCDARPADDFQTHSARLYGCFEQAANRIEHEGELLDRLTVFARLATTPEAARRRALWLAMQPLWRVVNGDNGPDSPYRRLILLRSEELRASGEVPGQDVRGIGVEPGDMERWLLQALEGWRDSHPDGPVEPWDWAWQTGAAARALQAALPVERLRPVADAWYRALGADLAALNVHYDLEDRPGKNAVAFCTFGARPRRTADGWSPGEPWVFATYRAGGLDSLYELLHENGHAVHIAAIRTRPAFADWPDSDIFTEGVAELAALDVFDAVWQRSYLAAAADDAQNHTAKFAATLLDMAWALFELRMLRAPDADPNAVWTELTHRYLHIAPHPEHAWWAVRGQLIDWPGYMMNYAAGAIMAADLRARLRELHGREHGAADRGWYATVSAALFRFGLERPSAGVLREFLGRPVSPEAFLREVRAPGGAR